jgi:hypothetical protein
MHIEQEKVFNFRKELKTMMKGRGKKKWTMKIRRKTKKVVETESELNHKL